MDTSTAPAETTDVWEKASIDLDIAIDEQDEQKCNRIVSIQKGDIAAVKDAENPNCFREALTRKEGLLPINVNGKKCSIPFWHVYFLGKRLRGILQNQNTDTQSKKLDWVVDILIREATPKIPDDEQFQYLLLMLELAACTMGEQSLGYAEKARIILDDINKNTPDFLTVWRYKAYEALIHYNQGVAKQHMALHDKALNEYDQSIDNILKVKESIDKSWLTYVYHPAILQKAEVLIKMQFSYNALTALKKVDNDSSSIFHLRRRELLKLTCHIDLSDWNRFDNQWETEINCRDKDSETSSIFHDDEGNPIFLTIPYSTVDKNGLVFLMAKKPQLSTQGIPFSIASQYNSLVLERAKEQLTQKVGKIRNDKNVNVREEEINKLREFEIFTFIEHYISQCKDNRFDRLTLQETIMDYVQIIGKLIDIKEKGFSELSKDNCRKILGKLKDILEDSHFFDEIDSLRKPPVQSDTVQKARKVIEEINDCFLKKWFPEKRKSPYELPEDVKDFFKFEQKLIDKLSSLKNRPDLLQKTYDKYSLEGREKLLKTISRYSFSTKNIKYLQKNLIIFKNPGNNEKCVKCLNQILDAIGKDQKPIVDKPPFTLQFRDYDNVLSREERRFHKHTTGRSRQPLPLKEAVKKDEPSHSVNYVGLRRWNSYTPELSFSVGGGHFVFLSPNDKNNKGKVGIGIAVDPGFDFIRNFFRQGFTLTDIDIILLTHGHPDHIRDFPAIVELLYENKKRGNGQGKKIYAVMSIGCYRRLDDHIVKDPFKLLFYDTIIVDIDKESEKEGKMLFIDRPGETTRNSDTGSLKTNKEGVKLIPPEDSSQNANKDINIHIHYFKAFHTDHSESDSYGYIIEFEDYCKNTVSIGFTGDSKWFPEYAKRFQNCNIICSHIGSIAEPKKDKRLKDYTTVGQAERLMRTKGHPYLFGEILFWQDWGEIFKENGKKTLMLMSEFGEEMKGKIRFDLAQRFNRPREEKCCWTASDLAKCKYVKDCEKGARNMIVIPVDVGLRISMPLEKEDALKEKSRTGNDEHPHKIHCAVCDDFVGPDEIDYEVYSHEEAIFYICQTCRRSTSLDVRHAIYQKYHEKGRDIEKYEES